MARIAIIGSCITRDLWPFMGKDPFDLLYVARTSLPSLFAKAPGRIDVAPEPPPPLKRHTHNAVVADLTKTTRATLVQHRPTHIIFDFIDERFDLMAAGAGLVSDSWELEVSGYLDQPALRDAQRIPRLSDGAGLLWRQGLAEMAAFLALTPLRDAQIILHQAQWADRYITAKSIIANLEESLEIMPGHFVSRPAHNAMLREYEAEFLLQFPAASVVAAPVNQVIADENHQWGLSPFHYVPGYYKAVCSQLMPILFNAAPDFSPPDLGLPSAQAASAHGPLLRDGR